MFILRRKIIFSSVVCLALSPFAAQSSQAQSNAAGVFGLIGGMIAAAQIQAAKEAWTGQPELRLYCAQKALARHNVTIPALIQNGVMPSDPRLAPIGSECAKFEPGNLKANYKCNALDENGATVVSTCNQAFGQVDASGIAQVIDARTAIDLYFSKGSFLLVDVESDAGRQQRQRQAERQRLIADLNALRGSVESLQSSRSESVRAEALKLAKRIGSALGPKAAVSAGDVETIRRDYKALAGFAANENARFAALNDLDAARSKTEQKLSGEIPQAIHDDFRALQEKYAQIVQEPAPVFTLDREQLAIGPTFDCAKAKDPLGRIICSDKELSRLDVDLLRPYYVLRFSAPDQRSTLKQDAVAFTQSVLQTCGIPDKGAVSNAALKKAVPCVAAEYRRQRDLWQAQMAQSAPVSARDETGRSLDEHVQLQKLLQEIGYIPATEKADGIYGAGTRTAISNFQNAENMTADGLLSDETAQRLLQKSAQSAAGGSDPSANARGQAARLAAMTRDYQDLAGRVDRYRAERARERELLATLAEAEAYASEKSAVALPARAIASLTGLKDEIAQVRSNPGLAALEHAAATFRQVKVSTDEAVMVLNATTDKNRFLIEGERSDILVLYNDSDKAPSLVKNLKGDLVFTGNKPSLCQRHDGSPEIGKVRLLNGHLARYGQSFTFPLPRCDVGNLKAYDVIVAVRQALASEKAADVAALLSSVDTGAFKLMFSVTDQDLSAAQQAEAALIQDLQKRVDAGSAEGFGLVAIKGNGGDVCLIAGEDVEAHQLLLQPHRERLAEDLKVSSVTMKGASAEDAFIGAKRGQCLAVYGAADDLKSVTAALTRDQVAFHYLPVWIAPEQLGKAREQAAALVKERAEAEAKKKTVQAAGASAASASMDQAPPLENPPFKGAEALPGRYLGVWHQTSCRNPVFELKPTAMIPMQRTKEGELKTGAARNIYLLRSNVFFSGRLEGTEGLVIIDPADGEKTISFVRKDTRAGLVKVVAAAQVSIENNEVVVTNVSYTPLADLVLCDSPDMVVAPSEGVRLNEPKVVEIDFSKSAICKTEQGKYNSLCNPNICNFAQMKMSCDLAIPYVKRRLGDHLRVFPSANVQPSAECSAKVKEAKEVEDSTDPKYRPRDIKLGHWIFAESACGQQADEVCARVLRGEGSNWNQLYCEYREQYHELYVALMEAAASESWGDPAEEARLKAKFRRLLEVRVPVENLRR